MAAVVLLCGANLGKRRFSPKAVEAELADLAVRNVGAAGTFVFERKTPERRLRARIQAELPWNAEMIVLSGADVLRAIAAGDKLAPPADARRFATAMEKPHKAKLPIVAPENGKWGVRVEAVVGRFALGVRKRVAETGVYPNAIVEKAFATRATTRDWKTMERIGALLERANA